MVKLKKVFQRKETKYLLNPQQYQQLKTILDQHLIADEYGKHTIMSLYFDTDDYEMIRHSIEKPVYKEKFRIRSYGVPVADTTVFLEIKKKVKGIVYKRRIAMTYQEALLFMAKGRITSCTESPQIIEEINWLMRRKALQPKVMIAYDRLAYRDDDREDFRITFDEDIRYRRTELDISQGDFGELVAPEIGRLMEVKALGAYPLWFSKALNDLAIYKASFSKYAQTYQRHIYPREDCFYVI